MEAQPPASTWAPAAAAGDPAGGARASAEPGAALRGPGDSLQQFGLQQALQAAAHHRLPEQGLLPALP